MGTPSYDKILSYDKLPDKTKEKAYTCRGSAYMRMGKRKEGNHDLMLALQLRDSIAGTYKGK